MKEVFMSYKRVLSIQDISCFGQCSLTVAMPVISACGVETCILPSALLSTHTMGFEGYTCLDLTEEMDKILAHWDRMDINFDAVYTGYLADARQMDIVRKAFDMRLREGGLRIVDTVMGDYGKLYPAFDDKFVCEMRTLVKDADIILPNITEASLLTDMPYQETYGESYIRTLLEKLVGLGAKKVVLTGVGYTSDTTGVAVYDGKDIFYYRHKKIARNCHGTGDLFASAFTGALMHGNSAEKAAQIAADFIVACIENTPADNSHFYGVEFEKCLNKLGQSLILN